MDLRIAICDDDAGYADHFGSVLSGLSPDAELYVFSDGNKLIARLQDREAFDVLFLDIQMPAIDGISLARRLRDLCPDAIIVFVTSHIDFVQVGYEVRAFRYLMKSQIGTDLKRVWVDIVDELGKRSDRYFAFTYERQAFRVGYDEIRYLESDKRMVLLHHVKGTAQFYGRLDLLEPQFTGHHFVRCHKSYMVNLCHVDKLIAGTAVMADGMLIPVSRQHAAALKQAFAAHHMGGGGGGA